jgi:hypothetical protein
MVAPAASKILSDDMLERFRRRAPASDRENPFFQEDFDELRQGGHLTIAVPRELGGHGFTHPGREIFRGKPQRNRTGGPKGIRTHG